MAKNIVYKAVDLFLKWANTTNWKEKRLQTALFTDYESFVDKFEVKKNQRRLLREKGNGHSNWLREWKISIKDMQIIRPFRFGWKFWKYWLPK